MNTVIPRWRLIKKMNKLVGLSQIGFNDEVEDAIAEFYAMQIVQRRMNVQMQDMRTELGNVMEQVKNLQHFHRIMLQRGKEWKDEQQKLVQLVCDLRTKEQLLRATIHTLVKDWLTPEQQADIRLAKTFEKHEERKALTLQNRLSKEQVSEYNHLARKIELSPHSSE